MHVQKQLFAERLSRASEELKEQGERGSPPRPALRLPPALRLRAESSRPPPSLPPTRCLSTPPSATSCPHPTPPGSVCLPGTSASPPSHPRAACNRSCDLPFKLEVINCANCRAHLLTCRDPTLCPGLLTSHPQYDSTLWSHLTQQSKNFFSREKLPMTLPVYNFQ
ncbi:PREDICTED: uncharacterized protein LOC102263139 isoform X8 [Myotis brandtii]|uniref:uncharacterized protein LOC102263139 isoform X8 n=1 Tax=Myotis brandtii TaxID=109478 RepID=UPI0007045547|nr:PREDICTED: uncharacterized protein LOC102263139 isoform X8 [Myotis brandtii]